MKLNHTVKPGLQQFADHVEAIVLKNAPLRADFKQRMEKRHFSADRLSLLEAFASVTLKMDFQEGHIDWWAAFTDYMKKTITILKMNFPELQQQALEEMIVFTRHTTQAYPNILNIETDTDTLPSYPARASDISSIPVLLRYLETIFVPVMEKHLETSLNMSHEDMEALLAERAAFFIGAGVPGYEILWYAPPEIRFEEPAIPAL